MSEPGPAPAPRGTADERWPDRFAAAMLVATSLVAVVALVPPWRDHFRAYDDPLSLLTIPIVPSLAYAALLAVMAFALRRRLRAAWWILLVGWLVLPEIGRIYDIVDGQDVALNLVGLVLIAGAIVVARMARPQFGVRRVAGSLRWALATLLVGGAVVLVTGAALVSQFGESDSIGSSAVYVLDSMLVDLGRFGGGSAATAPFWVQGVVGLAGMVLVIVTATILFRAPADTRTLAIPEEAKIRALLRDFGDHDSLGYFATRRDKSIVWDTGDAGDRPRRGLLPGRRLGEPRQRQPDRRPGALARRHRGLARAGPAQRLVGRGDGRRRGGRGGLRRGRADGVRDRRRGDRGPDRSSR